jgi:hypothetical protein
MKFKLGDNAEVKRGFYAGKSGEVIAYVPCLFIPLYMVRVAPYTHAVEFSWNLKKV